MTLVVLHFLKDMQLPSNHMSFMQELLLKDQRSSISKEVFTDEFISKLEDLEGECRIKTVIYLRINYLKALILTLLLTLSVVGLFLLKYFIKLRARVFYSAASSDHLQDITHIYVMGQENEEQISRVNKVTYNDEVRFVFEFKKLRYQLFQNKLLPIGFPYIEMIGTLKAQSFLKEGLLIKNGSKRQQLYGKNQHKVEVPGYFQFLFDTMTKPFFIFQYLVSLIFILQHVALFGFVLIGFSWLTTSINYVLLKRSYNKIKQTAEKLFKVKVFRNGTYQQIDNIDIVPGDLYEPAEEIPCDSIVVKGELFVDECNLTGENVPIAKFKIIDDAKHSDKSHWLFEGSRVETMKDHTLALAVNVGYASQRGRIIRKILNKTSKQPQFFMKLIYFQLEVMFVSFIIYFATLPHLLSLDIDIPMVIIRLCDFIAYSFPASFPVFFNLAYSFCLVRLYKQGIAGTQPQKTVQSSRIKTICFDKTGTLTLNKMSIKNVFKFEDTKIRKITKKMDQNALVQSLFACCNSVQSINGEVKGDEIDLRMFEFVEGKLLPSKSANAVRVVSVGDRNIEVIKINQYESQFQSMSVLLRDPQTDKHYVFIKGSPEMIHHYSVKKVQGFDNFVKKLSFSGYRSIGFGYKQIRAGDVERCLLMGREEFLAHTHIMGVVTFVNHLKSDAKSTINTLIECDINTKIITGDNIFLGVRTAIMVGMILPNAKITVIEGKNYNKSKNSVKVLHLIKDQEGKIEEREQSIQNFTYDNEQTHYYAIDDQFIKENPEHFLHDKVKVFARISPENKALIVRRHKERIAQGSSGLTLMQRTLKDCSFKVGMVGDGANDLIALKQAHVGIGISTSDAVFSASFAIKQLQQILQIINEGKNTQRQIIQMTRFYSLTQFVSIVVTIILSTDSSFMTAQQVTYKVFLSSIFITLFFGTNKPAKKMTRHLNNSNFLGLENHLVYWGILLIYSTGLIAAYAYYTNTPQFVPNTTHTTIRFGGAWYGKSQSSTIGFITSVILNILLPFAIYRSTPWKLPMRKNALLMASIIINFIMIVPISILTSRFSFLGLQHIEVEQIIIIWAIMLSTAAVAILFSKVIEKYYFSKMATNERSIKMEMDKQQSKSQW